MSRSKPSGAPSLSVVMRARPPRGGHPGGLSPGAWASRRGPCRAGNAGLAEPLGRAVDRTGPVIRMMDQDTADPVAAGQGSKRLARES